MEALRIVTRCTTREQFISTFRRFCTATSCFIPTSDMRPLGTATTFSIRLADGTQLLRGEGVVLDAWTTSENRFKRPGVHLGIHRLFDDSSATYDQLNTEPSIAVRVPVAAQLRLIHETVPSITALETPTIEMPPLALADDLECNLTREDDATPVSTPFDATIKTVVARATRDTIPYPPPAEIARDTIPMSVPAHSRDIIATLLGVMPLAKPQVYAAPTPVVTELAARVPTPIAVPIHPTLVMRRASGLRRIVRAIAARLRRWWVPQRRAVV
jgi:hypothetical protein